MMRMWFGLEIDVVGLPPLGTQGVEELEEGPGTGLSCVFLNFWKRKAEI